MIATLVAILLLIVLFGIFIWCFLSLAVAIGSASISREQSKHQKNMAEMRAGNLVESVEHFEERRLYDPQAERFTLRNHKVVKGNMLGTKAMIDTESAIFAHEHPTALEEPDPNDWKD